MHRLGLPKQILYHIRAAEIRVNACMALIVFKASLSEKIKVTDVASAEKLARATSDLVEEFEAMRAQKVIEQALRESCPCRFSGLLPRPLSVPAHRSQKDRECGDPLL